MKKREADFSVTFRHWLRANPMRQTCAFEMKQTTTDSLPFDAVEDHQLEYNDAIQTSQKGVLVRIQGVNGEPDYIYMYRDPVFVVIKYPTCFCVIPFNVFVHEKTTSKRKSLTAQRAIELSTFVV